MRNGKRNGRQERGTFRDRLERRHVLVRGMVAGAASAGYVVGASKAHVIPAIKATRRQIAKLIPESLRLTGHAYKSAVELGYDEEKARMAERAARRAWTQAKAAVRHAFGA